MSAIKRRFGWIPSFADRRNHLFALTGDPAALPEKVDLRPEDSPIEDQGDEGACTAFSLCGILQFLEKKDGIPLQVLSPQFLYYNERVMEGTVTSDSGA